MIATIIRATAEASKQQQDTPALKDREEETMRKKQHIFKNETQLERARIVSRNT
jgi:hypothetical protein